MTRQRLICAGLFCVLMVTGWVHAADAPRPNILFAFADDWSYPHASVYGDPVVKTPTFDRIAEQGMLFTRAYCAVPSCTASRGAVLTGQMPHRLENGANLWSLLPAKFQVYPDLLEDAGYVVGHSRKGWGPGSIEAAGRTRNPAGPRFDTFEGFLSQVPKGKPFCFWFGSLDPHRTYEKGSGVKSGMKLEDVIVPPYLPDTPKVRSDLCDYYWEVQRFDREVGEILMQIKQRGELDNTLVVMTSDNGMPFPRAKTNVHDSGTRMPLVISWPGKIKPGQKTDTFMSFTDFAPTFLEVAGVDIPRDMTGQSMVPLLSGQTDTHRERVYVERERHAQVRKGNQSYPVRAVRTDDYMYIRNFRPDRWPGGDPEHIHSVGPYGDIDGGPTKTLLIENRNDPTIKPFFDLSCAKRPAEELYDMKKDPYQLTNVAGKPEYATIQGELRRDLLRWMARTDDPRSHVNDDRFDQYSYFGGGVPKKK